MSAEQLTQAPHIVPLSEERAVGRRMPSPASGSAGRHVALKDAGWLGLGVLLLIATSLYCVRGRILWEDEMLGFLLLRDPSFHHMVTAWLHGADGGGFSFYLTGRLWFHLFGSSALSFRMYSEVCFAIGFAASWLAMRRFYRPAVVTFAALTVWLGSPVLVQHYAEGRFYGLFMAAVALTIYLYVLASERQHTSPLFCLALFLTHSLLITSHVLGVVYSSFVLLPMLVLDWWRGQRRWALYASIVASWLWLIPSRAAIQASAHVGKPFFWTKQPNIVDFVSNYSGFTIKLAIPIVLGALAVLVAMAKQHRVRVTLTTAFADRRSLYLLVLSLFLIPVVFYVEGMFGPALCISRYLQPIALATTILVAELITIGLSLLPATVRSSTAAFGMTWVLFVVALLAYGFVYRPRHTGLDQDFTAALTQALPQHVPVICEDGLMFTELISLQHDSPVRYTYLLDWQNSLSPQSPRIEVTQYHLMQNWKDMGYFAGSIQYAEPFLREHPFFYSVNFEDLRDKTPSGQHSPREEFIGTRLHKRLARMPQYDVKLVKVVPLGELSASVWRVCRTGSAACN